MTFRLILFGIFTISACAVTSHDSGSAELNRIEITPYYDAIVLSDVADIINEFENNMNPLEAILSSASDSEENIEDLLSEYQHYLDKAHRQKVKYLEKTKIKNKVPMMRHDRYAKSKPAGGMKYDDYIYADGYLTQNTIPQPSHSVVDFFIPVNSNKIRYFNKPEFMTLPKEELTIEKKMIELPPIIQQTPYDPIKSACTCKRGQVPCDCKPECKQCLVQIDSMPETYAQHKYDHEGDNKVQVPSADYSFDEKLRDLPENTLNVRIKVDIQLPTIQDVLGKIYKNRSREEVNTSKESSINFPFPYFNFPIPLDLLGYQKSRNPHDSVHKITIHKKKKSRLSNNNKKHKTKKLIFHNLNVQPAKAQTYIDENSNNAENNEKISDNSNQINISSTTHQVEGNSTLAYNKNVNNTKYNAIIGINETQTEESIIVMVNITNNDNATEDVRKSENSVETQDLKIDPNAEKSSIMRRKREIITTTETYISLNTLNTVKEPITHQVTTTTKDIFKDDTLTLSPKMLSAKTNETKKTDKALLADTELMYWPDSNRSLTIPSSMNITTIILDRENSKAKLNMSKEAIRTNRTRALEKAIFGDVNWDDVDTVAPVFLSFVGKYLKGVLTFCSENVCHSMKCEDKTCVHRVCTPSDRWNQRGHCSGSNSTDSIASLESIMDLPSNVAFEIVDILQDKMLGKIFGKVTLCIGNKCITFVASKKSFLKSKCSVKELKSSSCPNMNFKIV